MYVVKKNLSSTAPSEPLNVQSFCNVIVWKEPSSPNGVIIGYEVMLSFADSSTHNEIVSGDNTYYVIEMPLPPGPFEIKVQMLLTKPMSCT